MELDYEGRLCRKIVFDHENWYISFLEVADPLIRSGLVGEIDLDGFEG